MKPWFRAREIQQLVKMFNNAVDAVDALGAGAIFSTLFNLYQISLEYQKDIYGYRWRSITGLLQKEIDRIDKAARHYPTPLQQALVTTVTFYRKLKEEHRKV